MILAILILAYVVNIFLSRWLNQIAYRNNCADIIVWAWFIPIACPIAMIIIIAANIKIKKNWFTGKNW
jgi:hypothetical protein